MDKNCSVFFERYTWYLRLLKAKESERRKIASDINSGLINRDAVDPDWEKSISAEIGRLRAKLRRVEEVIDMIPETPSLMPCKIYLRLHYIIGCTITETAMEMNVGLTTLRRIRNRCEEYFASLPPLEDGL